MKKLMSVFAACVVLTFATGCKKSQKDEQKPVKKEHVKKDHPKKEHAKKDQPKKDKKPCASAGCEQKNKKAQPVKKAHDMKKKSSY